MPATQPVQHVKPVPPYRDRKGELVQKATAALKERWPMVVEPLVIDANEQLDRRDELRTKAKAVEEQMERFTVESQAQERQLEQLGIMEDEVSKFVKANEGREPDCDDLRGQLDPDSAQALDLLAEELALEEFLSALDQLFFNKKISIDEFMREVRDVSRRRFMCQVQRRKREDAARSAAALLR